MAANNNWLLGVKKGKLGTLYTRPEKPYALIKVPLASLTIAAD